MQMPLAVNVFKHTPLDRCVARATSTVVETVADVTANIRIWTKTGGVICITTRAYSPIITANLASRWYG